MPLKSQPSGVSVSRIGGSMVIALRVREAPKMCVMRMLRREILVIFLRREAPCLKRGSAELMSSILNSYTSTRLVLGLVYFLSYYIVVHPALSFFK
jgi:hypothetical protein